MAKYRRPRVTQFLNRQSHGALAPLTPDLMHAGQILLHDALEERREDVFRVVDNHTAACAPTIVENVVTTLNAAMNELLVFESRFGPKDRREYAETPLRTKLQEIGARDAQLLLDIDLLTQFRHEVTHHLPAQTPLWIPQELAEKLLICTRRPESDFVFAQKLASYGLAYWAWRVAERAIDAALRCVDPVLQSVCDYLPFNLAYYKATCPPERLHEYDQEHGLRLTI